jgi:hypothetical protein
MNDKFIQVQGPFKQGEDIVTKMKQDNTIFSYIQKLGIQSKTGNQVALNGVLFEIGSTGMLDFDDVKITSLVFHQDETDRTIIDCIVV